MMLAEAVNKLRARAARDFTMTERDRYELKIAGLLHDCGKVTTPVHVVDKATKLETIFDRIELVDTRFEVVRRDAELERSRTARLAREFALDEITRRERATGSKRSCASGCARSRTTASSCAAATSAASS